MRKQTLTFFKAAVSGILLLLTLAPLSPVHAQDTFRRPCVAAYASDVPTIQGIECLVSNILAVAVTLIGIAAFVMFLVGGFQYLTAGSNAKGVEQGRNSITFAIIGIVLALASIMILNIIARLTGVTTILKFSTQSDSESSAQPAAPAAPKAF